MRDRSLTILALTLALAIAGTSSLPVDAGWRRDRGYNGLENGFVIAHSRFGNGSVEGKVREARHGLEVRLPRGTWVGCRASCSETLRVETLDKFENQGQMMGYGTAQQECGIFGCLDVGTRFRE
jgi:hypothetical protein